MDPNNALFPHMIKLLDRVATALGWVLLLLAGIVLLRPGGLFRVEWDQWRESRTIRSLLVNEWVGLVQGRPVEGSENSEQVMVEFLDYNCAYCRLFGETADALLDRNPNIAIVYRFHPNSRIPSSRPAALAAICAHQQGDFQPLHRFLLTDTTWSRQANWSEIGSLVGISRPNDWLDCMNSSVARGELSADSSWAVRLGVEGTPTFVTQLGGVHLGITTPEQIEAWLAN